MSGKMLRKGPLFWFTIKLMLGLLAVCLLPVGAWGTPTTPGQARQVVQNWLSLGPQRLGATLTPKVKQVQAFPDNAGGTAYYIVFLDPAGLIIVPGDNLVEPVIGFLPEAGSYDPSPTNPLGALVSRDVPGRVARARELEKQARSRVMLFSPKGFRGEAQRKWTSLENLPAAPSGGDAGLPTVSDSRVAPLVQSKWGQTAAVENGLACYNYYTPPYGAGNPTNYPSGCGATSLAQLMRHHQYPATGVSGTYPIIVDGVPATAGLRGGNGVGGPYDWAQMVLDPDASLTPAECQAIGALTYDAGVAINTNYSPEVSTAPHVKYAPALVNTFHYSNAKDGSIRPYTIPIGNMINMANPSLDAGFPVILSLAPREGSIGHSVVSDGYGYDLGTLYHHLNMGWQGQQDAWYNLPNVDTSPSFVGIGQCVYNVFLTGKGEIISGRVLNAAGNPLSGATVQAVSAGGTYTAASNAQGIYALPKVPSGTAYTVSATKTGYTFSPQAITLGTSIDGTFTTGNRWGVDFQVGVVTIPLNTALDNAMLTFTTDEDAPKWFGDATTCPAGGSAARSGKISHSQQSSLYTWVWGPGVMTFYSKISSEVGYDYLLWFLDLELVSGWSGESGYWGKFIINVPPGPHLIFWLYQKDSSISEGADCGWVDKVAFSHDTISSISILLLD